MDEELDIIVIAFDVDARQAEAGLSSVFGLDAARARRFVRELPVVAKRGVSRASADRYVHALRSIGARVELRAAAGLDEHPPSAPPAATSSLPIPAPSMIARFDESTRVERETLRAIRRFRAAEGLDIGDALPIDLDPNNPDIPRPPALPRDLAKMPNAKLPRWGGRPGWMLTDPLTQGEGSARPSRQSPRPHADAELPPPPSPRPGPRDGAAGRSGAAPVASRAQRSESVRPSAVGLAHAATASVRPGIGMSSWWQRKDERARRRRLRDAWPIAALLAVAACTYLWFSGALDSEAVRRERALRAAGIEAGEYAPAAAWLEAPDHHIDGIDDGAARELVERLTRAGARSVHAVQIHARESGKGARGLVIELPDAKAERRTLLWHAARARGPQTQVPDEDGRYHLLTFQ